MLAKVAAHVTSTDEKKTGDRKPLLIVTYPEAIAELVVSQTHLDERRVSLKANQTIEITDLAHRLRDLGFKEVDYVYEPGQFAMRGSILDVYSFSSELPFRIDFFGDEVDTIRTFTVEDQLSKDRKTEVEIVPELASLTTEKVPFMEFLPDDALLVMKDLTFVRDTVERIYNEGFSSQALTERLEGATEMEQAQIQRDMTRDMNLCTSARFMRNAARFQHVFFGPSVANQSPQDLMGAVSTGESIRLTFHTSAATASLLMSIEPLPLALPVVAPAAASSAVTFSLSSSSTRAAVFLPMPDTLSNAAAFSVSIASVISCTLNTLNTLSASFGPTLVTPISLLNIARSFF